jgi:broad specificity phosphatase PhoE
VACAASPALRHAVFGDDDLDDGGLAAARALAGQPGDRAPLGRADAWLAAPTRAAAQTARAAGHEPVLVAELADCDYGRWSGRRFADVAAAEPAAVQAWLSDPGSAPHGGETLTALSARVAAWLDGHAGAGGRVVAVVPAAVLRAALVYALGMPPAAFWQLDVGPLAVARLRHRAGRWTWNLTADR